MSQMVDDICLPCLFPSLYICNACHASPVHAHTWSCALRLVAEDDPWAGDPEFLMEVVVSKYERRKSQTDTVNAMPLYPTEAILWDENQVPKVHYTGELSCMVSLSLDVSTFNGGFMTGATSDLLKQPPLGLVDCCPLVASISVVVEQ